MEHQVLETLGIIFLLGMLSQWVGWKFKIPVIVLLTISGLLVGPVFNIIHPHSTFGNIMHPLIELAVAIILFEGGMQLRFHELKEVGKGLKRLFTLGVILNWGIGTAVGVYIGLLDFSTSLLIAGILVVTGPTVIMPALREAKLKRSTANYLKWEGIVNDPVGALIAVLVYQYLIYEGKLSGTSVISLSLLKLILSSIGLTIAARFFIAWLFRKALIPEFLKIPFFITAILILFILAEVMQPGSGLFTVTFLGILIGNSKVSIVGELRRFQESVAVFSVSCIFIILSASLEFSVLKELTSSHLVFILCMAFLVRPIAIMIATIRTEMPTKEKLLIGLYGPRGIVAASVAGIVGAGLVRHGHDEGRLILPIIFSIVVITVVVHSFSLKKLAQLLGLVSEGKDGLLIVGASEWTIQLAEKLKDMEIPVMLSDVSWYKLTPARQKGIPVHYGQILHDIEKGEPDVSPFSFMLATTESDAYNTLVCNTLSHEFGSDHVYQLPLHEVEGKKPQDFSHPTFCSLVDSQEALFENMTRKYHQGWTFKKTKLSEEYNFEKFKEDNNETGAIFFLVKRAAGRIQIFRENKMETPSTGDSIISYANI